MLRTPFTLALVLGSTACHAGAPSVAAPQPAAAPAPDSLDACERAVAVRFHPPLAWSTPWSAGPADPEPYATCGPRDGVPRSRPADTCVDARGGWAGTSIASNRFGWALSDDGSVLARCDDACTVLRVRDGHVLERSAAPAPGSGQAVTEAASSVALFRRHGLTTVSLPLDAWRWKDVHYAWALAPHGSAVSYALVDEASGRTLVVGRIASATEYVFPMEPLVSKNGATLVVRARHTFVGQGLRMSDQVVDLPAAMARLYLDAAATDPRLRPRAAAACAAL